MATVTISQLGSLTPNSNTVLPVSDGSATGKATVAEVKTAMALATVASTGSYTDLTNQPTISNGLGGMQFYGTTGTFSWTVPAGVTKVKVTVAGGGGGSGGYAVNNPAPGAGGQSSFAITGITTMVATGGTNSANSAGGNVAGGAGGAASGGPAGTINIAGQAGVDGGPYPAAGGRASFALSSCGIGGLAEPSCTPQYGGGGGGSWRGGGGIGGGGSGGVSIALATVTPGTNATIVVGAAGQGTTSVNTGNSKYIRGQSGAVGCVLLEW